VRKKGIITPKLQVEAKASDIQSWLYSLQASQVAILLLHGLDGYSTVIEGWEIFQHYFSPYHIFDDRRQ